MVATVKAGVFAAVQSFAAKTDIRYYLKGILLDTGPDGAFLVATDGHAMAVARIDAAPHDVDQFLIPGNLSIKKRDKVVIERVPGVRMLRVGGHVVEPAEGEYPDWRRVIKNDPDGGAAFFDPKYAALVDSAARMICSKFPKMIRPGGTGAGYAQLDAEGEVGAWVMPVRYSLDDMPKGPVWSLT